MTKELVALSPCCNSDVYMGKPYSGFAMCKACGAWGRIDALVSEVNEHPYGKPREPKK